jgi:hypothetical protein
LPYDYGSGGDWSGFGQVGGQPLIYAEPQGSSYLGDVNYGGGYG